jgi:hypothetical protein
MYRIKNDYEMQLSPKDSCIIARCNELATHEYDNIYNNLPLCDEHFNKIKSLQFGE